MSHYTKLSLQIRNQHALLAALADLGFTKEKVEIFHTAEHLYGYDGDRREQTAHVIIRRKFVGGGANDIGFRRTEAGTYEALISEFDSSKTGNRYDEAWRKKLLQRYGRYIAVASATAKGFRVISETTKNGKLALVLGR